MPLVARDHLCRPARLQRAVHEYSGFSPNAGAAADRNAGSWAAWRSSDAADSPGRAGRWQRIEVVESTSALFRRRRVFVNKTR